MINNKSSYFLIKNHCKICLLIIPLILFLHLIIIYFFLFNYYRYNSIDVQGSEHMSNALKELKQLNHLHLNLE